MSRFNHDSYDEISQNEADVILSSIHYELLEENVLDQIKEPFKKHIINHLENYINRVEELYDTFEDADNRRNIREIEYQTYSMIIELIKYKFDFDINLEDLDIKTTTLVLYDFFIFSYVDNIENFYINFIKNNKKSIVENLKSTKKTIDLNINKKTFKNKANVLLISKFNKVIEFIKNLDISDDVFIETAIADQDDMTSKEIYNIFIEKNCASFNENCKDTFLRPITKKKLGSSDVLTTIQLELNTLFR